LGIAFAKVGKIEDAIASYHRLVVILVQQKKYEEAIMGMSP
jgi:hypothetical protein